MDGMGNVDHEKLGADYLIRPRIFARLANLVNGHVIAKRYLTYKHPEYYEKLIACQPGYSEFSGWGNERCRSC
jgi:predicted HD phosphohydrolase